MASQTIAGVEALFTKGESIFGQFPLRVALAGGGGVLDTGNNAADALTVGTAIINTAGGVATANRAVPATDPEGGGNATAYEYCAADPVNCTDLDGNRAGTRSKRGLSNVARVASYGLDDPRAAGTIAGVASAVSYAPNRQTGAKQRGQPPDRWPR